MHGEALGFKPEPISGIPPKVNREQRLEEPLSLAVVSIYLGVGVWGFSPLVHSVIFCFRRAAVLVSCSYLNEVSGLCSAVSYPVLQQMLNPKHNLEINCMFFLPWHTFPLHILFFAGFVVC